MNKSATKNQKNKSRIVLGRDIGVLIAAILIAVFFTIASPVFLTAYNFFNLLRQTAQLGIIAMAMTMLIVFIVVSALGGLFLGNLIFQ